MGNVQVEEARRQIEICIEAGVNLFDTADIYSFGKSEEVLGQARAAKTSSWRRKSSSDSNPAPTRPASRAATSWKPARRVSAVLEPITSISTRPTTSTPYRRNPAASTI